MMQQNANRNSHSLLLFQADCFVRGLTLRSNTVVENLCMRPNIGPAAAGPAGPVATAGPVPSGMGAIWQIKPINFVDQ